MSSLNYPFKFGVTVLATLVLSACGSSGSNSNSVPPVNDQVQQTPSA